MTDAANTFKPPWAVVAWCDDRFIYVEIPSTSDGPPYIFKESLTEGGLSKVLHLMRDARRRQAPRISGDFNAPIEAAQRVAVRRFGRGRREQGLATDEQRATARDIVKRMLRK